MSRLTVIGLMLLGLIFVLLVWHLLRTAAWTACADDRVTAAEDDAYHCGRRNCPLCPSEAKQEISQ
jgi:cbb3-type cytochrome oxidase subunit 3